MTESSDQRREIEVLSIIGSTKEDRADGKQSVQ
jgi:hypothetical protein